MKKVRITNRNSKPTKYLCIILLCLVAQLCSTLCDLIDNSLPGSSVHGILQARTLEWVAMPSSRGSFQPRDRTRVSWGSRIIGVFFTAEPPGKPSWTIRGHSIRQLTELLCHLGTIIIPLYDVVKSIKWDTSTTQHNTNFTVSDCVSTTLTLLPIQSSV